MTATIDNAVAELQRANAKLQRQLDERTAERDEALQRETATAEVLGVINSSPRDLAPVFDAMLEKATLLCDADFGILWNFDGELTKAGALHRVPNAPAFLRNGIGQADALRCCDQCLEPHCNQLVRCDDQARILRGRQRPA